MTAPVAPLQVLCVDDNADVLEVLKFMINRTEGLSCVGTLETPVDLVQEVESRHADVVLLDLNIPGSDPIESLRSLALSGSGAKVIVFTGQCDAESEERAVSAGAVACIPKGCHPLRIVESILEIGRSA
jgi:two-component system invasion response regulator UvrY